MSGILLASAGDISGIKNCLSRFYAHETPPEGFELVPVDKPRGRVPEWTIVKDGKPLDGVLVEKRAGRYRFLTL